MDSCFFRAGATPSVLWTTALKWRFEHWPFGPSSSTSRRMDFQPTRALRGHNFTASCILRVASEAPMEHQAARGIALALQLKDPGFSLYCGKRMASVAAG